MTAKETAEQLIEDFEYVELLRDIGGMDIELARQCALVCVNKLIENTEMCIGNLNPKWSFLQEVKQELQKM